MDEEESILVSSREQRTFWEEIGERSSPTARMVRAFAEPKVDLIRRELSLPTSARVLDVGCGNGFFTVPLARHWDVTGLDRSERMLELNPHTQLIAGSAEDTQLAADSFDLVFSSNLLHHVPRPQDVIREMARVSRRYVAFVEPNRNNPAMFLFSALKRVERGALKFSEGFLVRIVQDEGLRVVMSCTHGAVTPNRIPSLFLPLLKPFNTRIPLGFYVLVLAEKKR